MEEETKIIERLKKLKEAKNPLNIERERKFLEGLRSKLEVHTSQNPVIKEVGTRLWFKEGYNPFSSFKLTINDINLMKIRTKAIGVTLLILALSAGSVAFASQSSLPGDRLYTVKILSEEIRSEFTLSPDAKAKLESEFAAKRIEEIKQILSKRGVEPKGLDIAIQNLQKNSANATDIVYTEGQKGKDVSELAKDINGKMDSNKETLKQVFKEQINGLKDQEKALRDKIKEAQAAGNTALVESLTSQLEDLKSQRETLEASRDEGEDYIESESEDVQGRMKEDEKKADQKDEAQKAINEAESEKQDMTNEFNKEKIPVDAVTFAGFDDLIAQAKDAFAKGNYEDAKNLAKEAGDNLGEIEKTTEEENSDINSSDEYNEQDEMDNENETIDNSETMKNSSGSGITKGNEAFEKNASGDQKEKDREVENEKD